MAKPKQLKRKALEAFEIEGEIKPASGGRDPKDREPSLHDIDRVVNRVLQADGRWVLVDRNLVETGQSSTARYVALTRRGFEVASRHVEGVRNIWARWPHGNVDVPIPAFNTDQGYETDFGNLSD